MANNNDTPLESNTFSIDETIGGGMGDATLINDLFGSETATGDPGEIEPIIKEVVDTPEKKAKPVKPITPKEEKPDETNPEENILANFFDSGEDDDEGQGEDDSSKAKVIEGAAEGGEEQGGDEGEVSQFEALSKELYKLGVFTVDEGEEEAVVKTGEEFLERFQAEKKKGAIEIVNNFIGQFGEDYQDAFDAIYVKGVNPREYFGVYNEIVKFSELDLTQEENQIKVIRKALTDQGYEAEDVDTEIERLRNYGDLETVSAKHHKILVKKEVVKLQEMEQQATVDLQRKTQIKNLYIQNVQNILSEKLKTKEFDGIPINPQLASELQEFLLVDKWKAPSGELLTDFDRFILDMKRPENHAMKVKVALLLKVLEKDPTLSTIQKRVASKQANTLFESITKAKSGKSSPELPKQPPSWFR